MATLDTLKLGMRARIVDVEGDDGIAIRLKFEEATEGEEIELVGFAPLGDPIEFELRGFRLSLRKKEAQRVLIDPPVAP